MLSVLTALGGFQALGLLAIPPGRDTTPYPKTLNWGISCGRPNNRARFQKVTKFISNILFNSYIILIEYLYKMIHIFSLHL